MRHGIRRADGSRPFIRYTRKFQGYLFLLVKDENRPTIKKFKKDGVTDRRRKEGLGLYGHTILTTMTGASGVQKQYKQTSKTKPVKPRDKKSHLVKFIRQKYKCLSKKTVEVR